MADFHAWNGTVPETQPYNPGGGFGATRSGGTTYTRNPGEDETVEGRLTGLLSSGSDYIRGAEAAGIQNAARRGLLNSSMSAQSARQAAIAAAMPIAAADAGMFAQAAGQNVDWLNQSLIAAIEAEAAGNAASASSSAAMGAAQQNANNSERIREWERENMLLGFQHDEDSQNRGIDWQREGLNLGFGEAARDRGWRSGESAQDRGFSAWNSERERAHQSGESSLDREFNRDVFDDQRADRRDENRQAFFASSFGQAMNTLMSSPDFWGDPESAAGFMEFFASRFGSIIDGYF